jgi:hypothetical protein
MLIIAWHDENADAPCKYVGRLGFSYSCEGCYKRRDSRTINRPGPWDFHCHIRPGPGHIPGVSLSTTLSLPATGIARPSTPVAGNARRDQEKLHEYLQDHNCTGHSLRPVSIVLGLLRGQRHGVHL